MPRRSRGCQACRQRRIGCDGTLPSCRQCLLTNRVCSGPTQGSIIINQTEHVASRYNRNRGPSQHRPPSRASIIPQPSPKTILSLAFISEFTSYASSAIEELSGYTWLLQLSNLSHSERTPALDLSLQATATAYCGMAARNRSVVIEATRMYGEAISHHARAISHVSKTPTRTLIYTSVILSIFETVCATNGSAYSAHLEAARRMLTSSTADVAQNQLLRQIAVHVHNQTSFMTLVSPVGHPAAAPQMDNLTRTLWNQFHESQQAADQLTANLILIGGIVTRNLSIAKDSSPYLQGIGSSIENAWARHRAKVVSPSRIIRPGSSGRDALYQDASTALTMAHYAMAQIILTVAKRPGFPHPPVINNVYCQAVIDCALFLLQIKKTIGCSGFAMLHPLALVAKYSTSPIARRAAYSLLDDGLRGIAFVGLRRAVMQYIISA